VSTRNRFHAKLVNALVRRESPPQMHEILSQKTRVLVAAHSEDFAILDKLILFSWSRELAGCDRRTDRQSDRQMIAKTRLA